MCKPELKPRLGKAEQEFFLARGHSPIKLELAALGALGGWGRVSGRVLTG